MPSLRPRPFVFSVLAPLFRGSVTTDRGARVTGTFEFPGIGYDVNGDPTGDQANVENGTFDFALSK